jgi:hypothetical protein
MTSARVGSYMVWTSDEPRYWESRSYKDVAPEDREAVCDFLRDHDLDPAKVEGYVVLNSGPDGSAELHATVFLEDQGRRYVGDWVRMTVAAEPIVMPLRSRPPVRTA